MARTIRMAVLALALACLSGCASVRWVDDVTPGDLTGSAGQELGIVRLLGGPEPGEAAKEDDGAGDGSSFADTMMEFLILLGSY